MAVPTLYLFDRWDERVGVLATLGSVTHAEELGGEDTLELACAKAPGKGDRIVWRDPETGAWREHEVVRTGDGRGALTHALVARRGRRGRRQARSAPLPHECARGAPARRVGVGRRARVLLRGRGRQGREARRRPPPPPGRLEGRALRVRREPRRLHAYRARGRGVHRALRLGQGPPHRGRAEQRDRGLHPPDLVRVRQRLGQVGRGRRGAPALGPLGRRARRARTPLGTSCSRTARTPPSCWR